MKRTSGKSKTDFHPSVRAEIERRSGGQCEARTPHCTGTAVHIHHRRRRGRDGAEDTENGLHVCSPCHTYIHQVGREAYLKGWLVRSGAPVTTRGGAAR